MRVKPLVIGAPRSGFSLLIGVISALHARSAAHRSITDLLLHRVVDFTSIYLTRRYIETFSRHGIVRDLIFNGEFHLLVGGPKWLDKQDPTRMSVRKYFGVRGMGDFLMVLSHPREALEYYDVVHSHTAPALWLKELHYADFQKFTSIRNPLGIINSACFSLNAMASEHIQRFLPAADETELRERLALYKLTDITFVEGLVKFLAGYLDEYLPVRDRYVTMRWEDLITSPGLTIQQIAREIGLAISHSDALDLWRPMDHRNLLMFHKHNYRMGKGIVGDWKNSLVNEHLEVFRQYGFNAYLEALEYPPLQEMNPREYSPYQKLVARYIGRNEIYRDTGDVDLFGFAFNKSNIDASKFNFKSFPRRTWTHVERSTLTDDRVVLAVSDTAEDACERINPILDLIIQSRPGSRVEAQSLLSEVEGLCWDLADSASDPQLPVIHGRIFRELEALVSNS